MWPRLKFQNHPFHLIRFEFEIPDIAGIGIERCIGLWLLPYMYFRTTNS
jgi:hypothetical protein